MKRFLFLLFIIMPVFFLVLYSSTLKATGVSEDKSPSRDASAGAEYSGATASQPVTGTFEVHTPTPPPLAPQATPLPKPTSAATSNSDIILGTIKRQALRLPNPPVRPSIRDSRITALKNRLARYPTSADYRRLAELSIRLGLFPEAVRAYRAEAASYRQKGLVDAALIQENKAARYETRLQLYEERAPSSSEIKAHYTGARLEPKVGRYLGAFIDRDERLREIVRGTNYQIHRRPAEFARLIGKPHSTHFTYVAYGQSVPRRWLEMCKREGVIPHIAWEPKSLRQVQDDKYLRGWAAALRALDWPVFIRFAGEMNGFWTPYHGNPALYRAKFRLIHQVLRRSAPRVATIWCVNSVPADTIADYYPGDDGCDWVGINLYSVPFYDNNRNRPALLDNPLSLLDPVYKRYAARKPIAICEYGASHQAAVDKVRRIDFAIEKMSLLYGALPRLYPRVKMINWFDQNNLKHARAGRQLNNYSLTEQSAITNRYRTLVKAPDYLGQIPSELLPKTKGKVAESLGSGNVNLPGVYLPLRSGQRLPARARLSIWIKTYVARPRVFLAVDGVIVYAAQGTGAHSFVLQNPHKAEYSGAPVEPAEPEISASGEKVEKAVARTPAVSRPRNAVLTVYLYDDRNRFIQSQQVPVAFTEFS